MPHFFENRRALIATPLALFAMFSFSGCRSMNDAYIRMETWKYEKCFGEPPPGYMPLTANRAAPAMAPCQPANNCQAAPACQACQDGQISGGGSGGGAAVMMAPPGPAGSVTSGRPVIISDEIVLP